MPRNHDGYLTVTVQVDPRRAATLETVKQNKISRGQIDRKQCELQVTPYSTRCKLRRHDAVAIADLDSVLVGSAYCGEI